MLTFVHDGGMAQSHGPTVALTPSAFDKSCDRSGRPWVLDDLVDRKSLLADHVAYIKWQLEWIDRFDDISGGKGCARAAAVWITTPMDSVVMAARLLRAAVVADGPVAIEYSGFERAQSADPLHANHMQFRPMLGDRTLASQLLPMIAAMEGASFRFSGAPAPGANRERQGQQPWVGRLLRMAVCTRNTWRPSVRPERRTTLMLWTASYGARKFAAAERSEGRHLAVLWQGKSTVILVPSWRGFRVAGPAVSTDPLPPLEELHDSRLDLLVAEIDEWAQVLGAGELMRSRLLAFKNRVVPVIDRAADSLVRQLEHAHVDRLAAANPGTLGEFAALVAAQRHGGVNRILLQHGDNLMRFDSWLLTELQNFEEMWVSDTTVPEDLRRAAALYSLPVPITRERSPRVQALAATNRSRSARIRRQRRAIGYVPAMLFGDSYALDAGYIDDAWYHRWHLRLLDRMAAAKEHRFVWKALPGSDQTDDPIPAIIQSRGIKNVSYDTRSFVKASVGLSRVFFDFPSTALYEAVHLRLPVLAVVFSRFVTVRPSAAARFGETVHECEDEDTALRYFDRFIKSAPGTYTVDPTRLFMNRSEK